MTKRELHELYWMKKNIQSLEDRLLELETQATKITTQISATPKNSGEQDKLGNIVCKIVELQDEINYELAKMYAKEKEILKAIESLPSREACLMRLRYIDSMSWEKICIEMSYSWRQTHYIHAEALKQLGA